MRQSRRNKEDARNGEEKHCDRHARKDRRDVDEIASKHKEHPRWSERVYLSSLARVLPHQ
jgi:hypothetical protein